MLMQRVREVCSVHIVPQVPADFGRWNIWPQLNYEPGCMPFPYTQLTAATLGGGFCYHQTLYTDEETEAWRS